MDDPRPRARRTSSRTLAIAAVAVLVAIAVAGIMVAVLRGRSPAPEAAAAASAPSASASMPASGDLHHVAFSKDSEQLSPVAVDQIRRMAESTKDATSAVVLSGKIESASDSAARMDLVKKRINAVRRALQANGISPGRVRVEIAEYPVGRVAPADADIVEMNLR